MVGITAIKKKSKNPKTLQQSAKKPTPKKNHKNPKKPAKIPAENPSKPAKKRLKKNFKAIREPFT
jgi:hypothetical protein